MTLRLTPLFDWHRSHGGRMVEFGGWEMPVQYTSIVDEHQTVRSAVGLFDISHMGRLHFSGPDAAKLLGYLLTCRVDDLIDGQIRYGLVCNAAGGVLDDILVNRITNDSFGLVVNASNRDKIVAWIEEQQRHLSSNTGTLDVVVADDTERTAMLAVQGPHALPLVNTVLGTDLTSMKYYTGRAATVQGQPAFVSRTGYTGEDGFEIIVDNAQAVALWDQLLTEGAAAGIKPCGLGCRDTLRLEAAMPLYGHELSEQVNPLTAGLRFAVKLDKHDFVGRDSLIRYDAIPDRPKRVGLKLSSRRIAREHSDVYIDSEKIGVVTSGTFSPTLEQSIAMAYLASAHASVGTHVEIDIRGKREPAEVVALPFYKRKP
ncbi:glycine cleavage system aminomethyltransferase GcvT [Schlesneria paludicola]|uniref:glycine cleavage system aminomethyltransferase GcvT n=1 Tax=Schlesneria paludicola TaxID=360056 RepID=UPI00029AA2F8|nr:glycine cleavage system aminomethyltransferase GcvT [Schlesneria paludicola]